MNLGQSRRLLKKNKEPALFHPEKLFSHFSGVISEMNIIKSNKLAVFEVKIYILNIDHRLHKTNAKRRFQNPNTL